MTGLSTVVGSAIGRPGPAVHVAGQHARTALDLDEEEAGRREHQRIDLADLALVVDELEVGPDVPGIAVGQLASKPVQRLSLPREVGLGDDMPAGGAEGHGFTSRPSVDVLEQVADLAVEEPAELLDGREIDPCGRLLVEGGDRAAIQPRAPRNVRDAKLVSAHEGG